MDKHKKAAVIAMVLSGVVCGIVSFYVGDLSGYDSGVKDATSAYEHKIADVCRSDTPVFHADNEVFGCLSKSEIDKINKILNQYDPEENGTPGND
jgi:hypothetical protein